MRSQTRLYVILARESPYAVVFRRGPSRQVLLLRWNTQTDAMEEGQWLKGRIYERRCDLSPDGTLLIYFAANWKKPYDSWTAVSRPPYLTALALWPKGNAWGGGGHFEKRNRIALNHRQDERALADGFKVARWLQVVPFGTHPGWGEDHPIWGARLERDGWTQVSEGRIAERNYRARSWIGLDPHAIWEKRHRSADLVLRMIIRGIGERNGAWYITDHDVNGMKLGRTEWADWSANGDLLFSRRGSLFRVPLTKGILGEPREIVDLSDRTFVARESPESARRWR